MEKKSKTNKRKETSAKQSIETKITEENKTWKWRKKKMNHDAIRRDE